LPVVEKQLSLGHYKLQDLFPLLKVKEVDFTDICLTVTNPFKNINTREELLKFVNS